MNNNEAQDTQEVDIEQIMQEIRQEILLKKRIGKREIPAGSQRFSSNFYEELYQAELLQGDLGIKMLVTKSKIPLIGRLIDALRAKLHELVLFYVNQTIDQQSDVNDHLIQAVTLLAQELDEGVDGNQDGDVEDDRLHGVEPE